MLKICLSAAFLMYLNYCVSVSYRKYTMALLTWTSFAVKTMTSVTQGGVTDDSQNKRSSDQGAGQGEGGCSASVSETD